LRLIRVISPSVLLLNLSWLDSSTTKNSPNCRHSPCLVLLDISTPSPSSLIETCNLIRLVPVEECYLAVETTPESSQIAFCTCLKSEHVIGLDLATGATVCRITSSTTTLTTGVGAVVVGTVVRSAQQQLNMSLNLPGILLAESKQHGSLLFVNLNQKIDVFSVSVPKEPKRLFTFSHLHSKKSQCEHLLWLDIGVLVVGNSKAGEIVLFDVAQTLDHPEWNHLNQPVVMSVEKLPLAVSIISQGSVVLLGEGGGGACSLHAFHETSDVKSTTNQSTIAHSETTSSSSSCGWTIARIPIKCKLEDLISTVTFMDFKDEMSRFRVEIAQLEKQKKTEAKGPLAVIERQSSKIDRVQLETVKRVFKNTQRVFTNLDVLCNLDTTASTGINGRCLALVLSAFFHEAVTPMLDKSVEYVMKAEHVKTSSMLREILLNSQRVGETLTKTLMVGYRFWFFGKNATYRNFFKKDHTVVNLYKAL
jgi:hypothetical protein